MQSDKLVIVPHFLLAPVGTVVKSTEHEFAHRPSPSPEAVSRIKMCVRQQSVCTPFFHSLITVWEVLASATTSLRQAPGEHQR